MNEEEKEWITHALMDFERRRCISKVLKLDYKDAVGKGDNYFSDIFRLKLKVILNSGDAEERSLIYKIIPQGGTKVANVKESGLFAKEARIYMEVLPEMERLLKTVQPDADTLWPQMFGVRRNFEGVLMEDVTVYGFRMGERLKELDFDHVSFALKELALFHALGAVIIEKGEVRTDEYDVYHFFKTEEKLQETTDSVVDGLVQVIEENWKGEWLQYVEDLKRLKVTFVNKILKAAKREENKFHTLLHGDYWTNNILFKYDNEEKPKSIKMVDYQMMFYNTPCFDIHYLFTTSLRAELYNRRPELLSIYSSSLQKNLKLFGYSGDIPTSDDICENYENSVLLGHYVTLTTRPFMICPSLEKIIHEHIGVDKNVNSLDVKTLIYLTYAYGTENNTNSLKTCLKDMKARGIL